MKTTEENLEHIRQNIAEAALRRGRRPDDIRIVGVTKTVSPQQIASAIRAGIEILGGNYVQETLDKMAALSALNLDTPVSWHFIGRLQSNKAKFAVRYFDLIHSVHNEKLAAEINRQAARNDKVQDVLIQVNTGDESSKNGINPNEAPELVRRMEAMKNTRVRGLMTMPPFFDEPERVRPFFRILCDLKKRIEDEVLAHSASAAAIGDASADHSGGVSGDAFRDASGDNPGATMDHLSMGMTGDYETAVEEGATLVRIGTAIFGERQ